MQVVLKSSDYRYHIDLLKIDTVAHLILLRSHGASSCRNQKSFAVFRG